VPPVLIGLPPLSRTRIFELSDHPVRLHLPHVVIEEALLMEIPRSVNCIKHVRHKAIEAHLIDRVEPREVV
jgi:hypothetical protein